MENSFIRFTEGMWKIELGIREELWDFERSGLVGRGRHLRGTALNGIEKKRWIWSFNK